MLLQFEVDAELIKEIGQDSIKNYIVKQLKLLKLKRVSNKITESLGDISAEYAAEVEKSRDAAWKEYKEKIGINDENNH